jgi:hypothetical protein
MTLKIAWTRLRCQRLTAGRLARPEDVVGWLGAVQAQEYALAKWGLALRMRRATDASVERAFASGAILRTHLMRATWHFVTPADIRWLLALTAPRVRAAVAHYDRRLGIDAAVIRRANRAIAAALAGGAALTRRELKAVLVRSRVPVPDSQHLAHVIMHAELDAVICSGPRREQQFTYMLLDRRAPAGRALPRAEALGELAWRYFTSHGPAQVKDFAWWSGLTSAEVRAGLELAAPRLAEDRIDGARYWFSRSLRAIDRPARAAYLLPPYDEYLIGYRDRSASLDPSRDIFTAPVVLDGRVVGGWRRTIEGGTVSIAFDIERPMTRSDAGLIEAAARSYGDFSGLEVKLESRTRP